jgi:hypothetical protein
MAACLLLSPVLAHRGHKEIEERSLGLRPDRKTGPLPQPRSRLHRALCPAGSAGAAAELNSGERWHHLEGLEPLKEKARAEGLWNLFMPPGGALAHVDESFAFEGEQLTNLEYALCAEEMGRVGFASEVFNCSAPDTGNMEVLHRYGTRGTEGAMAGAADARGRSARPF